MVVLFLGHSVLLKVQRMTTVAHLLDLEVVVVCLAGLVTVLVVNVLGLIMHRLDLLVKVDLHQVVRAVVLVALTASMPIRWGVNAESRIPRTWTTDFGWLWIVTRRNVVGAMANVVWNLNFGPLFDQRRRLLCGD